MPRFFFHFFDRLTWQDEEGEELTDRGAARVRATGRVLRIAADAAWPGGLNPDHGIRVADEQGVILFALTFRDVLWRPPRRSPTKRSRRPADPD
jgi:hypothetical protein